MLDKLAEINKDKEDEFEQIDKVLGYLAQANDALNCSIFPTKEYTCGKIKNLFNDLERSKKIRTEYYQRQIGKLFISKEKKEVKDES